MTEPRVIRFTAHGEPVAWQRTGLANGRHFTKPKTRNWQTYITWAFQEAAPRHEAYDGPVSMAVTAYVLPPLSIRNGKKHRAALEAECIPVTTRPDADNYAKAALDALNGLAYTDDARVHTLTVRKLYSTRPRLEVVLTLGEEARTA